MKNRVFAIAVAYYPQADDLRRLIAATSPQVDRIILVCNSPIDGLDLRSEEKCTLEILRNPSNVGIAAAQNLGLRRSMAAGAEFILLLDQDSLPPPDLVSTLANVHKTLTRNGTQVAALAPLLVDQTTGNEWAFQRTHWLHTRQTTAPDHRGVCQADFLYSSGSLISLDVLRRTGGFMAPLFIDHVDLEWCMRARSLGYLCFGVPSVRMDHRVGDGHVRLFGRLHPIHSAQRDYYVFRNSAALMKLPHISFRWKLNELVRLLPRAFFYSSLHSNPTHHLAMCLRGLLDGFLMQGLEKAATLNV